MRLTDDLTNRRTIFMKGWLFLVLGLLAAGILFAQDSSLQTFTLLGIAAWAFCRWYYFMFYVIEHYVDGAFSFDGIGSFLRYMYKARIRERP